MSTLLLGHKGRCFDVRRYIYNDKDLIYTASEDGTAKLWSLTEKTTSSSVSETLKYNENSDSSIYSAPLSSSFISTSSSSSSSSLTPPTFETRCIATVNHSMNRMSSAEVLRACALGPDNDRIKLLCTAGSDGILNIFSRDPESTNLKYKKSFTTKHRNEESQVYACEPLSQSKSNEDAIFITAADNELHLWNSSMLSESIHKWCFSGQNDTVFGGVSRNPNREAFIFDAKPCPSSEHANVIAVALSDGTIRLIDIRQPGSQAASLSLSCDQDSSVYATSVGWSSDACSLLAAQGSGNTAVLDMRMPSMRLLLRGHASACFGAAFLPGDDSQCVTWSSDATMKWWDLKSVSDSEQCMEAPRKTVKLPNYPIYSCALALTGTRAGIMDWSAICAGGQGDQSFVGNPVHLIPSLVGNNSQSNST